MSANFLFLLWFLRLMKVPIFLYLNVYISSNVNTVFFCKKLIWMRYLCVNKKITMYLFYFGKWAQIPKFCIFGRYTQFIYLIYFWHVWCILSLNWLFNGLPVVFQLISSISYVFLFKLDCIKTGAGGSPWWLAVVVSCCALHIETRNR